MGKKNFEFLYQKKKENEMFAIVNRIFKGARMDVQSADGKSRMARIPGRMKRKLGRIRIGDLIIISPWDVQNEKADIIYRYRKSQIKFLIKRKMLPYEIDSLV